VSNHWKHDEPEEEEPPPKYQEPETHQAPDCQLENQNCFGEVKLHHCEGLDGGYSLHFCEYHLNKHLESC